MDVENVIQKDLGTFAQVDPHTHSSLSEASSTKIGRKTFEKQLHDSEDIYKDTTNMLQASRDEASSAAKALVAEMNQAQSLIKKISAEASSLQKDLLHNTESASKVASSKDDDSDDEESEDSADDDSN